MSSAEAKRQDNAPISLDARRGRRNDAREFLPAALEIVETPASRAGRAIAGTIMLFFVIVIGWSIVGHVDIIAAAQGKIVPTGRTKTIQPLEAGVVAAIHVQDGDKVRNGDLLVELDHTVTAAERRRVAQGLMQAKLDVARLSVLRASFADLAELRPLAVPEGASPTDVARTRAALQAQAAEQQSKLASNLQQIAQKRAEAQSIEAAIAKIDATLPFLQETADIRRNAKEIQYGNQIAFIDAQSRLIDQQSERIVQTRRLVEIEAARLALEQQLAQTRSGFERQVLADLTDAEKKAEELTQDLVKAERKIAEQVLRAPIDGTVQQLALHTVGGVVTPAQQLMLIVPADSQLEAEAMISNRDIGFVNVGQSAEIKIDTFNFTRYGLVHGKVLSVSQDSIVREKPADKQNGGKTAGAPSETSEPAGQEFIYSARVSLDEKQMQVEDKMVALAPGMAVTVEIKTGTRRIIEYVMSPLLRYRQESLRER
ncbi:HlyD family type I secretion periplasmic adaptor subunit [Bradyrhizobium sp. SSBR45G]|uniref:HlyD family type I secretion periplasmic adaptor subunit n=1 Tax=unclassified Bradyrhizobium TaxID=2631580 RepID=UPI002342AB29|nr:MULTISPECIES: HlyD family type I secretion periplasmic adaptor subunit [unclassified Bradyrhizobium]GLH77084.1 HlyD family type I secretion periplasmic adaptor subunit [Bradyrhizobium sp. SSBR45G]GLH83842.1 HlyD family type I secretion periplasmic adaptor subunit [Bradyrhizobium sp. SSBR45R]